MVGHGELTPGDNIGCDSPGLCDKIRFAKEHLVTNEYSSQTYRSTPKNQAIKAATVIKEAFQDKLLHYNSDARRVDAEANGMPTPEKESHLSQSQKKPEVECLKHPSGNIERPAAGEKKPPQPPFSNHLGFPKTRAPSSSSSPHLGSAPQRFGPPPCIPLTSEEIALRARIIGTRNADKNQPKAEKLIPRVRPPPTPRPSYPTDSVRKSSSSTSTSAPRKPSNLRTVFSLEDSQDTAVKMTQSDGSDEVVIPNRDRRRDNNKQARGTWRPNSAQNSRWPRRPKPEPFQEIGKQNGSHATNDRQYLDAPVTPTSNLHKGVSLANDNWADQHTPTPTPTPTPSTQKENHRTNQHEEEANELAQLRKQIVVNAHRRSNDPPPGAEMLSRCRDGPGTQLHSKEYRAITDIRTVPQEGILDSSYFPGHSQMLSTEIPEDADPEDLKRDMESQLRLCQELYRKSATAYPIVPDDKDDKIMLSPMPSAKQKDVLVKLQSPRREFAPQPIHLITGKKAVKTRWSDPKILDWEYCPAAIYDVKLYHERFQNWLENTIECARTVDIFHQAFFNGTAHADGQISMFMLDMRNHDVHLDPDDKESWSYAHESAAGYCCNIVLQNKKALEEQELRKQLERKRQFEAQQLQPPRTPTSPVANIYLRPVEPKDVPQLREIYNWYAGYSIDSPNTEDLDEDEVRQRVEDTRNANLPFIVAIDRRSASTDTEKILGYALAREFDRHHLAHQFTAELEVYVKDGHKRLGIGRCLLDKLLEVCDPTYVPKPGYRFEAKREDRSGYYGGGRRKLARLIFTLCYVDQKEITDHTNVKNWLREYAGFEEQGLLRGIRVKNGYL